MSRLASLPAPEWSGIIWRHMFATRLPVEANTRGARWNPPDVATIYASLERATAIAEGDHQIAMQPLRPAAERFVYQLRTAPIRLLDLRDRRLLDELGVGEEELLSAEWSACQLIGGAVAVKLRRDGILIPSVRARNGTNVAIFAFETSAGPVFEMIGREKLE